MSKIRITFDVEPAVLFEMMHKMHGDCAAIGTRLIGVMMTGEAGFAEAIGMATYGITVADVASDPDSPDGTSGQDRESYSDTQDRDSYTVSGEE